MILKLITFKFFIVFSKKIGYWRKKVLLRNNFLLTKVHHNEYRKFAEDDILFPLSVYLCLGNGLRGKYCLGAWKDCGKRQVVQISNTRHPRNSHCFQWSVGDCDALWWRLQKKIITIFFSSFIFIAIDYIF